jgi:hypothetical protein
MNQDDIRPAWQLPTQWPHAEKLRPVDRQAVNTERLLKGGILLALLASTVFARFGLALSDGYSVPAELIALYALVGAMVLCGAVELNSRGALAYVALSSVAAFSFLVNAQFGAPEQASVASFLLLIVLYAPFAVSLRQGAVAPSLWRWLMTMYLRFALVVAIAGIAQFLAQFVAHPPWLFDFTPWIPRSIQGSGEYLTVQQAGELMKSNGFFLREPTSFSFAMAFALLCEMSLTRRKWAMAIFATGLMLTYSGSGLLALAVAMLFPLRRRSLLQLAVAMMLAVLAFLVLGDALNLSYTVDRADEINANSRSSAYLRFIDPGLVLLQHIDTNPWTSLLGHGPGSLPRITSAYESTFAKAPFEYGLLGSLSVGLLMLLALNRSACPIRMRVALGLDWVLLGSALLSPGALLGIYLISAMWPERTAERAVEEARA